jgi:hypothetical protein
MKIFIFGRPCSLIGYRIYQLSPKSAEKGQKSVMQKRHKRVAGRRFFIPVTPIKIENHEDFYCLQLFLGCHISRSSAILSL